MHICAIGWKNVIFVVRKDRVEYVLTMMVWDVIRSDMVAWTDDPSQMDSGTLFSIEGSKIK